MKNGITKIADNPMIKKTTFLAIGLPIAVIIGLIYARIHYASTLHTTFVLGVFDGVMLPYLAPYSFLVNDIPNFISTKFISFYSLGYLIGLYLIATALFTSFKKFSIIKK